MSLLARNGSFFQSSVLLAALLGSTVLFSGCATLFGGGGSQDVTFESDPDKAEVYVRGQFKGKTPLTTSLDRSETPLVRFKKEGYRPESVKLKGSPRILWFALDFPLLFPLAVDFYTGAIYTLEPNPVSVSLREKK